MKQKKIMGIFLILFLISLSTTIGLFIATKLTFVNPETVTATVISTEKIDINIGIIQRPRYIVTVRYNGHENKCYVSATAGHAYRPMQQVQAYIFCSFYDVHPASPHNRTGYATSCHLLLLASHHLLSTLTKI